GVRRRNDVRSRSSSRRRRCRIGRSGGSARLWRRSCRKRSTSLTITPDGSTLVGLMQNPVDNPDTSIRKTSRLNRLVLFDPKTGASRQYAYMLEAPSAVVSEIAAVTGTTFIVSERDQLFPGDTKEPSKLKRIYKIDISR